MSVILTIAVIAVFNTALAIACYTLGTKRDKPLNIRKTFRTLIEKPATITSPAKLQRQREIEKALTYE